MLQHPLFKLRFVNSPSPTIFTASRIEAEDGSPIAIELVDAVSNTRVTSGSLSSSRVEIVALDADLTEESWTTEVFNRNILWSREGKRSLLVGDLIVILKDGVGVISGEIAFTDDSTWLKDVYPESENWSLTEPSRPLNDRGFFSRGRDFGDYELPYSSQEKRIKRAFSPVDLGSYLPSAIPDLDLFENLTPSSFTGFMPIPDSLENLVEDATRSRIASQPQLLSGSSSAPKDYDIVIKYRRGENNEDFISHLLAAFSRKRISVLGDFGEVDAVPACRVLIIFLTSTYVPSNLLSIVEQQWKVTRVVFPIFYGISPSDFISNSQYYERLFLLNGPERWHDALKELTQMQCYILTDKSCRPESEVVAEIVRDALKVIRVYALIGMDMQIKDILSLLCIESPDVRSVGIWGTVGIGKTAIAEKIFRRISFQFETCVFLKDLHQEIELKGPDAVRENFLSEVLEVEPRFIRISGRKTSFLRNRLQCKRVLVVLDDVNDFRDAEPFLGKLSYFGPGSRIIVTSRNRRVFVLCKINHVYEVKRLDNSKALRLLDRGAGLSFFSLKPKRTYSPELVKFSNGNPQGTSAIEGLFLDMSQLKFDAIPSVFEKMCNLRLLKFHFSEMIENHGVYLPQGLEYLPSKLRLLHWEYYPVSSLPQCFDPKNLVELNLPNSCVKKLWKGKKSLEKLKTMRLSYSHQLTKIPRLSKNLEFLDLEGCKSLVSISQSICYLKKLVSLNLKDCSNLESVPSTVDLDSLEVLNLSGCSKLENFPETSPNVKELYLGGTMLQEIPSSIKGLVLLEKLDLENSRHLVNLPTSICKLKHLETLNLSGCSSLERFPDLSRKMKCLKSLDLSRTAIKELPSSISYLTALEELRFVDCRNLARLPDNMWSLRFKIQFRHIDTQKFARLWNRLGWLKKVHP
ncbi:unnamed protein product [Eruca vesicaria subsp. sativa]|uniref:TIR domain-containing protein n=1 Tax=Eruca vesicaria subsp. sativa TaxID=29727 RepID=A0ABC8ITF7_ERUVS|nr:unnamed protein product [Eruca vesicaria subsp. sativa]